MNREETELQVFQGSVTLINLEVAVAQLVADVDEENRILEYDQLLHVLFDSFILINCITQLVERLEALCIHCSSLDIFFCSE